MGRRRRRTPAEGGGGSEGLGATRGKNLGLGLIFLDWHPSTLRGLDLAALFGWSDSGASNHSENPGSPGIPSTAIPASRPCWSGTRWTCSVEPLGRAIQHRVWSGHAPTSLRGPTIRPDQPYTFCHRSEKEQHRYQGAGHRFLTMRPQDRRVQGVNHGRACHDHDEAEDNARCTPGQPVRYRRCTAGISRMFSSSTPGTIRCSRQGGLRKTRTSPSRSSRLGMSQCSYHGPVREQRPSGSSCGPLVADGARPEGPPGYLEVSGYLRP